MKLKPKKSNKSRRTFFIFMPFVWAQQQQQQNNNNDNLMPLKQPNSVKAKETKYNIEKYEFVYNVTVRDIPDLTVCRIPVSGFSYYPVVAWQINTHTVL